MNISFINKSKALSDHEFKTMVVDGLITWHEVYFSRLWHTTIDSYEISHKTRKGYAAFYFLDNADVADALGYHDVTPQGMPLAKIFVETTLNDGQSVSVTASHELAEMLVDPTCVITVKGPHGWTWAYETADAVEETSFKVNGLDMTNFVLPTYFQNIKHPAGTKYDYLGLVKKPFQLLPGGYAAVQKYPGEWTNIYGSVAKSKRFAREDRRGHRIEESRMK